MKITFILNLSSLNPANVELSLFKNSTILAFSTVSKMSESESIIAETHRNWSLVIQFFVLQCHLLYKTFHHPLSGVTTARNRVAVVMEQGAVERHNMTKFHGSWMERKLCCILVVLLDLENSEEGCILRICDFWHNKTCHNNESNGFEYKELERRDVSRTWHFCPTWSMNVSRLFGTSGATKLATTTNQTVSNTRSWNEETCQEHDTSVRLGRWSKRNDTSCYLKMAVLD